MPLGCVCMQAAANKLKAELATFGCPPIFPVMDEDEDDKPPKEAVSAEAAVQNKCTYTHHNYPYPA